MRSSPWSGMSVNPGPAPRIGLDVFEVRRGNIPQHAICLESKASPRSPKAWLP